LFETGSFKTKVPWRELSKIFGIIINFQISVGGLSQHSIGWNFWEFRWIEIKRDIFFSALYFFF